jgi:hypothetical protein
MFTPNKPRPERLTKKRPDILTRDGKGKDKVVMKKGI